MHKIYLLIYLILVTLSNAAVAEGLIVEAKGTVLKTTTLSNDLYQTRAIANALQTVVHSSPQSLGSFSLIENGKVLFDQISSQSSIKIGGYRILSTQDHGDKFSVSLEVLILPSNKNNVALSCRQPKDLDIALNWKGITLKRSMPFWMQIDEQSIYQQIASTIASDDRLNIRKKIPRQTLQDTGYSLYDTGDNAAAYAPKYEITAELKLDLKNENSLLQRSKTLTIEATTELARRSQIIRSTTLENNITLSKSGVLINGPNTGRQNLENIQKNIYDVMQQSVINTLRELECKNFAGKIIYQGQTLKIDFGFQDGLLETDIFSSAVIGTKQFYFSVKQMKDNYTTLHALSNDTKAEIFDGLDVQLLERF